MKLISAERVFVVLSVDSSTFSAFNLFDVGFALASVVLVHYIASSSLIELH